MRAARPSVNWYPLSSLDPVRFTQSPGILVGNAFDTTVSHAGSVGLIGGGYGGPSWLAERFDEAAGERVGVGFITWSLRYRQAFMEGEPERTGVWFGEAAGLIHAIEPAGLIVQRMTDEPARCLRHHAGMTPAGSRLATVCVRGRRAAAMNCSAPLGGSAVALPRHRLLAGAVLEPNWHRRPRGCC
jgi:hypothetical protein